MIRVDTSERAEMHGIISDIMARHRDGALSDPRGRSAVAAFVTSYAPIGYLNDTDETALNVYVDITLQMNKVARAANDAEVLDRVEALLQIALGDKAALPAIRALL